MLQAVINIDSVMRRRLCSKLHSRLSHFVDRCSTSSIDS